MDCGRGSGFAFRMKRRQAERALLLTLVLFAGACAERRADIPRLRSSEPAAILQEIREREDKVHSLRAVFTAETTQEGRTRKTDGVLVVKKPGQFRLRL